jgi:serine/threonine-protein kinase
MDLAPGTMVNANVRLVELLGHGGMGSVWLADHLSLETRVAVKVISPQIVGSDPSLKGRFKREAQICAKLRSIHVVQTFDHGVMEDGRPYIVMELLEGKTLTDLVERGGPRPMREAGMIVAQIGKVLHRAHGFGIVHRDIKPDNIFITSSGDYEMVVKVLDFGIAKQTQSKGDDVVTKTGAIVGSPEFMSPEQAINSKDVDHRTDLFSLGVVAYYALTGELPFDYDDPSRPFWIQLTSGEHIRATKRNARLPPAIDAYFARALQPKPEERFQSALDLADALATIADPTNAAALSDLSSTIDDGTVLPPHLAHLAALDVSEQATVRMRLNHPRSEPPPMPGAIGQGAGPSPGGVRGVNVSGAYVPPMRGPLASAPTVLSEPPGAGERPPWAATQYRVPSSKVWVAVLATLAMVVIVAALMVLA